MPIYDFICPGCKATKPDVFTKSWMEKVFCSCGKQMAKAPCGFAPKVFPADGIFLEHVSPEGKRFFSRKEMKDYAKKNDLEIAYLED